jgi:uncharacterized protein
MAFFPSWFAAGMEDLILRVIVALATGVLAGTTAGLFGVGGGIIIVPILHYVLGLEFPLATAISLLVIAVNTPFGIVRQHHHRNVLWGQGLLLILGGAVGVLIAMALRPFIPIPFFKVLFALIAGAAGFRLIRPLKPPKKRVSPAWLPLVGVAAGMIAHWLGIGGGLLIVPTMLFLGTAIHQAVATSLVPVFTNAAVSTAFDIPLLIHHLGLAIPLVIGAIVGIRGGVHLANRLSPIRLQRAFAVVLGLLAVYMLYDALL